MLSKRSLGVIEANKKGYLVAGNGVVWYKGKVVRGHIKNKNSINYLHINIRMPNGDTQTVPVHQLHAYQKYGDIMFKDGIQVRHLDNNSLNNIWENIGIGSPSENMMDRPKDDRKKHSMEAASYLVKYDADEIREDHASGLSYSDIMKKYDISSKGTVSHIINKRQIIKPRVV